LKSSLHQNALSNLKVGLGKLSNGRREKGRLIMNRKKQQEMVKMEAQQKGNLRKL
jgi:hypothetical protein